MAYFKIDESGSRLWAEFSASESANAFSLEAARELGHIVKQFRKWSKPVIVSSGHSTIFCSGGNLSEYKKLKSKAPGLKINREIQRHLDVFGSWRVPKLAVIEGDVLGGGVEWLARFDARWCAPHAMLAFWQRRIGLSSGWGGGRAWAEIIGEESVRSLLLEARLLSAYESRRLGLVDRVVSGVRLRSAAEEWAARISVLPGGAVVKWNSRDEEKIFASLWMGDDHRNTLKKWK